MPSRKTAEPQALDAHGQRVEPEQLYEAVDGFCTEVASGVEFSASRGTTALGSTDVVQRCPSRFKRAGSVSPPPSFTLTPPWQPAAPPPPPSADDYLICSRRIVGPSAGVFVMIDEGNAVRRSNPVVQDYSDSFREPTPEEHDKLAADLARAV